MAGGNKIYDVKTTDTAWKQMLEHSQFLANISVETANRHVDEFVVNTGTLTQIPERYPWLEHDAIPFQKYCKIFFGQYHMAL